MMILVFVFVGIWWLAYIFHGTASDIRRIREAKQAQVERDYLETVAMIGGHVDG